MKWVRNILLAVARSPLGGALVCWAVRHARLLPLRIEAQSAPCVMMRHPQPMAEPHFLIVPKKRAACLEDFLREQEDWLPFARFVEEHVRFEEVSLCCNSGCRQEVGQVHFHAISKEAPRMREDKDARLYEVAGCPVRFSEGGHLYVRHEDLPNAAALREIVLEGKKRYPKGFSVLFV